MSKGTVLILVGPEYEDLELWYPKLRLEEAGYTVKLASSQPGEYRGKHGYPCRTDTSLDELRASELAGVVVPGGWAPDKLRRDPLVLGLVRELYQAGKLVAAICHGPWVLISAGIVRGHRTTSSVGIRDDLHNAGAEWVDLPCIVDRNLVTARVPKDLPAFAVGLLEVLGRKAS